MDLHDTSRARKTIGVALGGLLVGGLFLAPGVLAAEDAPAQWDAIQLKSLADGQATEVTDVNNDGTSVGSSAGKPVRWDDEGVATALSLPAGCTTGLATTINEDGAIAGYVDCGAAELTGVAWTAGNVAHKLEDPLLIADLTDNGFAVGQRDPDSTSNDTAFAYRSGIARLDLPTAGSTSSAANGLTEYGFAVGTLEGVPTLPSSVAIGWYGNRTFPLVKQNLATEGVDVIESAHVLVQIRQDGNDRGVIVEPKKGNLIALDAAGDNDVVVDLNENGITVGSREDDDVVEGRFYLAGGTSVAMKGLVSGADREAFVLDAPAAINDDNWVVGNHGDVSWLLRPGAEPTTTTTAAPTTTAPEETTTTVAPEEPEVTTTTVAVEEPEVTTTTVAVEEPEEPEVTTTTAAPEPPVETPDE